MNQPIETLNLPKNIIKELKCNGYFYCEDLPKMFDTLIQPPPTLNLTGSPQKKDLEINFNTFNEELDSLFKEEIDYKWLTELCGLPGTGKTQLCFHLAVSARVADYKVIYISTKGSFSLRRLKEISVLHKNQPETILEGIYVKEIEEFDELDLCLTLIEKFTKENEKLGLVIIDSISYLMKQIDQDEWTHTIYRVLGRLEKLAKDNKFCTIIVNDFATIVISEDDVIIRPTLGDTFYNRIGSRIVVYKDEYLNYKANIMKSIRNPSKLICFKIV